MTTTSTTPAERDIVITRVLDAPRGLVFKTWTEPDAEREMCREGWGQSLDRLARCLAKA